MALCALMLTVASAPSVFAAGAKVAALELRNEAGLSDAESSYLTDRVRDALVRILPATSFKIMTRESIQELLPEGVSLSDCLDASCDVEIGRTLGADYIVTGEILLFADEYRLNLKVHDCVTASFLGSETTGSADLAELEDQVPESAALLGNRIRSHAGGVRYTDEPVPSGDTTIPSLTAQDWLLTAGTTAVVNFSSSPPGAAVLVDGRLLCVSTPCSRELATGLTVVTMRKDNYLLQEEMVNISADGEANFIDWSLTPDFGWVGVTTEPAGLPVEIDGRLRQHALLDSLVLAPGLHEIRVADPRYKDSFEVISVGRGLWQSVNLQALPREGALRISAMDADSNAVVARVVVDGTEFGQTPCTEKLLIGSHRVLVVAAEGRWQGEVQILEEQVASVVAELGFGGFGGGENTIGISMVRVESGQFLMGSPPYERERDRDENRHQVTLTRPFLLGATEVTQQQWRTVMNDNPAAFTGVDHPVENVTWLDCIEFCNGLSALEQLVPAYKVQGSRVTWNPTADGYRLPTEAEWELACRSGSVTRFHGGDRADDLLDVAWYHGNSGGQTQPVGHKAPNAWGLHDMHGNVWEWCWNWSADYPDRFATDPRGPDSGVGRVIRGGAWDTSARGCRSANHNAAVPQKRTELIGFRVARTAQ